MFTALYIGAVIGANRYLGPVHVYRMTDQQALKTDDVSREAYAKGVVRKSASVPGTRWYADNTREPIRDETLRGGLVAVGAVAQRDDLPTTSGRARYALKAEFAALFNPSLNGEELAAAIEAFQSEHLSKSALARITIMRSSAVAGKADVLVSFPNGETRHLAPGDSSVIAQGVVEIFAPRFLVAPAVLWLSESGNKVVMRDDKIANALGLNIEADKNLPDMILVDLGPKEPLLVFVEVVATDGAMTPERKESLYALTDGAGFERRHVAFLTAYRDRQSSGFKKTVAQLAWGTFAWFVSEPDAIVIMRGGQNSHASIATILQA